VHVGVRLEQIAVRLHDRHHAGAETVFLGLASAIRCRAVCQATWQSLPSSSRWWRKYGRNSLGTVSVHMAWGTGSSTSSRRKAAKIVTRWAPHDGHRPRLWHEKATRYSFLQVSQ
jgi:hypothetical protein